MDDCRHERKIVVCLSGVVRCLDCDKELKQNNVPLSKTKGEFLDV